MPSKKAVFFVFITLISILILVSCGKGDGAAGYTVVSPVVAPGQTLSGTDFIIESAFGSSEYSVTLDTPTPTDEPGLHKATITVSDDHGYKHTHSCSYTVLSFLRDSVRIEAGSPITIEEFINTDIESYKEHTFKFEDELAVAGHTIGTYRIGIYVDDNLMYSSLILEDTTPPSASPVTVHITSATEKPMPADFVSDIKDATSVICSFKEEYDFNTTNDIYVTVVLTDEAGNTSEVTSFATCSVDTTPPKIEGVHDINVIIGESVSYRDGVTVTDDSGETLKLVIDNSRVNLKEVGSYEVTYSATDSSGNNTIVHATVNVIAKPEVSQADMEALAKNIYKKHIITKDNMTQWDIARAVYDWTHDNIKFTSDHVDKNDPIGAAYNGMKTGVGDCFTYMTVARELLEIANIPCRQITRLQYEGESAHYWLLVDVGDGWYHFDSCWHFKGKSFDSFMRTDAELEAYCEKYNIEYYYRFDKSKYPVRSDISYYNTNNSEQAN